MSPRILSDLCASWLIRLSYRMFDHVAHLAGALFGLVYYQVGPQIWTWLRIKLGAEERRLGL